MPSQNFNRILWAVFAIAIAFFALRAQETIDALWMGVGKLDVRLAREEDALYLRWRGKIDAPMEAKIEEAIAANGSKARKVVLSLSSPGGSIDHGARVIRLLKRIGETHALETVVEKGRQCASMCVPIYLQGETRVAAADARFMFHEVSFSKEFSDDRIAVPEAATNRETDKLFGRYFESRGVPEAWIRDVRAAMAGGNDVWKTARELVEEKSGIVQNVRE